MDSIMQRYQNYLNLKTQIKQDRLAITNDVIAIIHNCMKKHGLTYSSIAKSVGLDPTRLIVATRRKDLATVIRAYHYLSKEGYVNDNK